MLANTRTAMEVILNTSNFLFAENVTLSMMVIIFYLLLQQ